MTTSTWNGTSENEVSNYPKPIKIIVPIMLMLGIVLGVIWYFMSSQNTIVINTLVLDNSVNLTVYESRIFEMNGFHALDKHGIAIFDAAVKCLTKYGSTKSFKTFGFKNNKDGPKSTFLCIDLENNEWYGVVTTIFKNKVATIITIYKVAQETYPTIEKYVEYLKRDWGAIEINYAIEAAKFIIKPVMELK